MEDHQSQTRSTLAKNIQTNDSLPLLQASPLYIHTHLEKNQYCEVIPMVSNKLYDELIVLQLNNNEITSI